MSKSIELKTIYDLLGLNFFVPSYQRGYRWTEQQVKDLLQDIYDFAYKDKEKGEFYCLQPIVVKQCDAELIQHYGLKSELDGNRWYEVIDGQHDLPPYISYSPILRRIWVKHRLRRSMGVKSLSSNMRPEG